MSKQEQAIEYLKQLRVMTVDPNKRVDNMVMDAVYRIPASPAGQLRERAQELELDARRIEEKSKLLAEIDQFLLTIKE